MNLSLLVLSNSHKNDSKEIKVLTHQGEVTRRGNSRTMSEKQWMIKSWWKCGYWFKTETQSPSSWRRIILVRSSCRTWEGLGPACTRCQVRWEWEEGRKALPWYNWIPRSFLPLDHYQILVKVLETCSLEKLNWCVSRIIWPLGLVEGRSEAQVEKRELNGILYSIKW